MPPISICHSLRLIRVQAQSRGTNASNPNRGRLAAQVEANNKAGKLPEPQQEERLVVSAFLTLLPTPPPLSPYVLEWFSLLTTLRR